MTRASNELLDAIHGLVTGSLKEELERARNAATDEENPVPINPQLIDKAIKWCQVNDITAPKSNKPLNDLAAELSDIDVDNEVAGIRH